MAVENYESVNKAWPGVIPPITRQEAERAAAKLRRHFRISGRGVRECWIAVAEPYGALNRGWRRLVHDLSHDWFRQVYPRKRGHDPLHARYEEDMLAYVLSKGWLDGLLKPAPAAPKDMVAERHASLVKREAAWMKKLNRARTALAKITRQRREYERRHGERLAAWMP